MWKLTCGGISFHTCTNTGVQILGDDPPFTVGGMATISCISDSDATMIEWFDGSNMEVNMTTTGRRLDNVLGPVRDDLHETTFTCRVTRTTGVAEQSITLTVTGNLQPYNVCAVHSSLLLYST